MRETVEWHKGGDEETPDWHCREEDTSLGNRIRYATVK